MPNTPVRAASPVLTPTAVNRLARECLEEGLGLVQVEGELSNVARPASGHLYFTLKDTGAQVRCAMFRPRSTWLRFRPAEGMHVLARARVSLYEPRGEYQLIVEALEEAGEGALRREFERLRARLEAAGLFDPGRKRPLPAWPRRIGVITSPSGAAIHDVLHVLARRFPLVQVEILPVPVQGAEAPAALAAALRAASAAGRHDVLLLTRGGGSLEDLAAFNDEDLARAIHASQVPVVSAVGHETDVSIADFVADLRAATPSAAAEILVPDGAALRQRLEILRQQVLRCAVRGLQQRSQKLDHAAARLQVQHPHQVLRRHGERLHALHRRLLACGRASAAQRRHRVAALEGRLLSCHPRRELALREAASRRLQARLAAAAGARIQRQAQALATLARTLQAVSPLATLERGYAILLDADSGAVIGSIGAAPAGRRLRARLADGELPLQVLPEPD